MILQTDIVIYAIAGVCVILIAWIIRLEIKMKHLLIGKGSTNIEDSLEHLHKETSDLRTFEEETRTHLENIEKRMQSAVRSVETIRFNPFKGAGEGGNQSFATAIVNEKGGGVVLSSLYSRDRMSVFSKGLNGFKSEFELSTEEKEAIKRAKEKITV